MKKFLSLIVVCLVLSFVATSCGSSKGSCDAYGSIDTTENSELASK